MESSCMYMASYALFIFDNFLGFNFDSIIIFEVFLFEAESRWFARLLPGLTKWNTQLCILLPDFLLQFHETIKYVVILMKHESSCPTIHKGNPK